MPESTLVCRLELFGVTCQKPGMAFHLSAREALDLYEFLGSNLAQLRMSARQAFREKGGEQEEGEGMSHYD